MEQDDINKFIHDLDLTRAYFEKGNGNISVNEALMYAVIFSRYDVAKYLIKKGADPNWKPTKKDEFYENPLLNLILSVNVFWGEEANLELIKTLLLAGADPHMKDKQGHDAYYYASINYPKRKRRIIDMLNLHAGSLQNLARAKVPQKTLKKNFQITYITKNMSIAD